MLKLRQAQIDAVVAARWQDFFTRSLRHVRETMAEFTRALSDADLRRLFDSSVARSHSFELRAEPQILAVFESTILLGDCFERRKAHEWALEVLQSRYLDGDHRAALLLATAKAKRPPTKPGIVPTARGAAPDETIAQSPKQQEHPADRTIPTQLPSGAPSQVKAADA